MHFLPHTRLYPGMHSGGLPTGLLLGVECFLLVDGLFLDFFDLVPRPKL
jgi:hypothetical protein